MHAPPCADERRLVRLLLHADELGVGAAVPSGHEVVVRAHLGDGAGLQDGDEVGLADGGEPVRDDEGGAADHEAVQRLLHQLLRLGVQRACGLVEEEDGRVLEHGPGNGDPLLLAAGELQAALANLHAWPWSYMLTCQHDCSTLISSMYYTLFMSGF
jgi:hypothetical protein